MFLLKVRYDYILHDTAHRGPLWSENWDRSSSSLAFKGKHTKMVRFCTRLNLAILKCYNKLSLGYFELRLPYTFWEHHIFVLHLVKRA